MQPDSLILCAMWKLVLPADLFFFIPGSETVVSVGGFDHAKSHKNKGRIFFMNLKVQTHVNCHNLYLVI